jgi:cell division protein FtsB
MLASSVLGVGLVWAGVSAFRGGESSATVIVASTVADGDSPDDVDVTLPPVSPDEPDRVDEIAELTAVVRELGERVEALAATVDGSVGMVESLNKTVASVAAELNGLDTRVTKGLSRIDDLETEVIRAAADAIEAKEQVGIVSKAVTALERKAAKLADDGSYTGTVKPSQLSPRLTTNDVTGNWPLNRVSDKLRSEYIEVNAWGCSSDYRFHTVLAVSAFRQVECVRIPK